MSVGDVRVSLGQQTLHWLLKKIYPTYPILWEVVLPGTLYRFDLVVPIIGLIVEFDGRQHSQYVHHFHRDIDGYVAMVRSDNFKNKWAADHGVKLLRVAHDNLPSDEKELKKWIDDLPTPNVEYNPFCFFPDIKLDLYEVSMKEKKKEYLTKLYHSQKEVRKEIRKKLLERRKNV